MKKIVLHICLPLFPLFSYAQFGWRVLHDAPKSYRLDDFFFLNPQLGWAIHPNFHYMTTPQPGQIFKTTNGGLTWQLLKDSSITYYRSIGFADALTGWTGNLGPAYCDDSNILYQTNDGGTTWSPANVPYPHPPGICGISVVNDSVTFAYGTFYGPAGYLKTTNKGVTWNYQTMSHVAQGLVDGWFFNEDTGFISGRGHDQKSIILYTVDGGVNWSEVYHSTRTERDIVWKLFFPSRRIGYASLQSFNDGPERYFLKTTDGGITWAEYPFTANYNEEGIGFLNDSVGWIGGDEELPTYITTNGGTTWNVDSTFGILTHPYHDYSGGYHPGFAINRFRRFGDTLMYASGNTVYKLNTKTTGIAEVQSPLKEMYNYPNPFNKQTTFRYFLEETAEKVTLEIQDIAWKIVRRVDLGKQFAGKHEIPCNMELPTGVYYYTVFAGNYKKTKKMIVIQ